MLSTVTLLFFSANSSLLNRFTENDQKVENLISRSDELASEGKPYEALILLQRAQTRYPKSIRVNAALAIFYSEIQSDTEKAEKYLRIARQFAANEAKTDAQILMAEGVIAFQRADYADARKFLTKAYQGGLHSSKLIEQLGAVLLADGKPKVASRLALQEYDCRANKLTLMQCFQNIAHWHELVAKHEMNLTLLEPSNANKHNSSALNHQAKSIKLRYKSLLKLLEVIGLSDGYFRISLIKAYESYKKLFEYEVALYEHKAFSIRQKLKDPDGLAKSELSTIPH
ncbi:MAG: hypothetical protein SFT81_06805 [Candidatus Caenarcaniphilales bacterium]|nr:hypothetical protein [Candidatus Caenarcaniphilales bacterium]